MCHTSSKEFFHQSRASTRRSPFPIPFFPSAYVPSRHVEKKQKLHTFGTPFSSSRSQLGISDSLLLLEITTGSLPVTSMIRTSLLFVLVGGPKNFWPRNPLRSSLNHSINVDPSAASADPGPRVRSRVPELGLYNPQSHHLHL